MAKRVLKGPPSEAELKVIVKELRRRYAEEQAAERSRARAAGKSPMPRGTYDLTGDLGLIRVRSTKLDTDLAKMCDMYTGQDPALRKRVRRTLVSKDFSTLYTFSMRSAVFALRGDGEAWLRRGLTALALMDVDRFDYRDFSMAVTLLHATAGRLGIKHGPLFKEALQLASPKTGSWFRGYITRKPPRDGVERSGMFRPIVTDDGPGYISSGFGALDLPNHVRSEDLSAIALDIADYLGRDDYEIDSVEVDGPVPEVWLASDDTRAAFLAAQKAVTAAASVHLHHRKGRGRKGSAQDLVIFGFLNRLKTEAAARTLLDLSRTKTRKDVALLGVQEKKLFLLLVAESIMHGVRPVETTESLRRFAKGLQTILRRHARAAARRR